MSERYTTITLPGAPAGTGYSLHGYRSVEEMIKTIRENAEQDKKVAEAVLAAADNDFRVVSHLGVIVRRFPEVIQEGKKLDDA